MEQDLPLSTVKRAQQGYPEDLGRLYSYYHQSVFRYLYYRTGDIQLAEDLTGDVFIKLVKSLPEINLATTPLQAWLFMVARNLAIDHFRRNQAHPEVSIHENLDGDSLTLDSIVDGQLTSERLANAISKLDKQQRDVLVFRFIEGMPIQQVASILHKSEDAVKSLQRRALMSLRKQLESTEADRGSAR